MAGVPDYSKHANEIADDITKLAAEDIEAEILEGQKISVLTMCIRTRRNIKH